MSFKTTSKNWEGLAQKDALWAICTNPNKRKGKWDEEEFFKMGELEIDKIISYLKEKTYLGDKSAKALDFGCGVGRISRALSKHFDVVSGVDVSETMINKARIANQDFPQLSFFHNPHPDLRIFNDNEFDLVYTSIVLQHISYPESLEYIKDFKRIIRKDGLAVFQFPTEDKRNLSPVKKLRNKLKIRERLAMLGIGQGFHMEMNVIPEKEVIDILEQDGEVLEVISTNHTDPSFDGNLHLNEEVGQMAYTSKMFVFRKLT